jgi:hypothetical protein
MLAIKWTWPYACMPGRSSTPGLQTWSAAATTGAARPALGSCQAATVGLNRPVTPPPAGDAYGRHPSNRSSRGFTDSAHGVAMPPVEANARHSVTQLHRVTMQVRRCAPGLSAAHPV